MPPRFNGRRPHEDISQRIADTDGSDSSTDQRFQLDLLGAHDLHYRALRRCLKIGVRKDDVRRLAAEFQADTHHSRDTG